MMMVVLIPTRIVTKASLNVGALMINNIVTMSIKAMIASHQGKSIKSP
jgi:hypothetical protein